MACPRIQVFMPHQQQATRAGKIAGMFAPRTPDEARTQTGNGTPQRAAAWAFNSIGTNTIRFPRRMVSSAWIQLMPPAINPDASIYVGMQTLMATQSDA